MEVILYMSNYTISEFGTLPSEGKIYKGNVNPRVRLRSMTTEEEMRRLAPTEYQYNTIASIIDDCMIDDMGISAYDLHVGDYQYLLHKLRVVTYGNAYPSFSICPVCGRVNRIDLNLDEIPVIEFNEEEFNNLLTVELPVTKNKITLKYTTPRDLDEIDEEERKFNKENPENSINIRYLITLRHAISTVNGQLMDRVRLDQFLRKLPMKDTNVIYQHMIKINEKVGIDTKIDNKCSDPKCGAEYATTFRITPEFFGPTI